MTKKERMAKKYLKLLNFKEEWIKNVRRVVRDYHDPFDVENIMDVITTHYDFEKLENKQIEILVRKLTFEQLEELYDFYSSQNGRVIQKSMSEFIVELQEYMLLDLDKLVIKLTEEDKF